VIQISEQCRYNFTAANGDECKKKEEESIESFEEETRGDVTLSATFFSFSSRLSPRAVFLPQRQPTLARQRNVFTAKPTTKGDTIER
jgi:hypothetical protein